MSTAHLAADTITTYLAGPFDGITYRWDIFGSSFDTWWKKLFGGFLFLILVAAAVWVGVAVVGLRRANSSARPGEADQAKTQLTWAVIGFAGAVILVPILGFITAAATV